MQAHNKGQIARLAARIFRLPRLDEDPAATRNGHRILGAPLLGPALKSYWPNRIRDLTRFWKTPISTEVPLLGALDYVRGLEACRASLPIGVARLYKASMAEYRAARNLNLKKGTSKVTKTNLGKLATSSPARAPKPKQ